VSADNFYTSALATASFLSKQKPRGSAFVIGEPGLISALYDVGACASICLSFRAACC
jgi:NagD protein